MKRKVGSGAINREPRQLRRGNGYIPVYLCKSKHVETVENGLGAAHRRLTNIEKNKMFVVINS